MAQVPIQGFDIGQRVWFQDGRNGIIREAVLNPIANEYQYDIEGLGFWFLESDLLVEDPSPLVLVDPGAFLAEEPTGVPGDFITRADFFAALAAVVPGGGVPQKALDDLGERLEAAIAAAFNAAAIARDELAETFQVNLDELREDVNTTVASVASQVVTQQTEIQERARATLAVTEAAGDGGLSGFISRVTGFITSPAQAFLDLIGTWFVGEVRDGLNR